MACFLQAADRLGAERLLPGGLGIDQKKAAGSPPIQFDEWQPEFASALRSALGRLSPFLPDEARDHFAELRAGGW
jgi:hypothetical protein